MAVDDSYTKLLMHFNGTNGSTTFVEESGRTVTVAGNAQISTAQYKFGGASGLFDGNGDYLSVPDSDDWQLDGGSDSNKWTVDLWVRFAAFSAHNGLVSQSVGINNFWRLYYDNDYNRFGIQVYSGGDQIINLYNSFTASINTWYHVAYVKNGTSGYMMFVNGSQIGSTQTATTPIPNFAATLRIADCINPSDTHYYFNGYMDELRISKGVARWISNFTPPVRPYGGGGYYWII